MSTKHLSLSDEQYQDLLTLLHLGEWMVNSHRETIIEQYDELIQHVSTYAAEFNAQELVEYDEEIEGFAPTLDFEEEYMEMVEEYDEVTFWDELITRLVERDLGEQFGEEELQHIDLDERLAAEFPLSSKYEAEFDQYGIDRLKLDNIDE